MRAKIDDIKEALDDIKRGDILNLLCIYLDIHSYLHKQENCEKSKSKRELIDFKKRNVEILHQKLEKLFERIRNNEFNPENVTRHQQPPIKEKEKTKKNSSSLFQSITNNRKLSRSLNDDNLISGQQKKLSKLKI